MAFPTLLDGFSGEGGGGELWALTVISILAPGLAVPDLALGLPLPHLALAAASGLCRYSAPGSSQRS